MYFEKLNLYMRIPKEGNCYPTFPTQKDKKYEGALNWVKDRPHSIEEDVDNYFTKSRVVDISYR